jgi:hypothetical protein
MFEEVREESMKGFASIALASDLTIELPHAHARF